MEIVSQYTVSLEVGRMNLEKIVKGSHSGIEIESPLKEYLFSINGTLKEKFNYKILKGREISETLAQLELPKLNPVEVCAAFVHMLRRRHEFMSPRRTATEVNIIFNGYLEGLDGIVTLTCSRGKCIVSLQKEFKPSTNQFLVFCREN